MTIRSSLSTKDTVNVQLNVLDAVTYYSKYTTGSLKNEVPTKLTATKFQTSETWVTNSLSVFLNGIKVPSTNITKISSKIFTIVDETIDDDLIEIQYMQNS